MKELFYKYFEGRTSVAEEEQIMNYVDSSVIAKNEFLCERKLWDVYTLHGEVNSVKKMPVPVYIKLLKVAAVFLLVFSVGLSTWYFTRNSIYSSGFIQTIHVNPGGCVEHTLPDGSKVWLNANTTLTYPAIFGKKQREVTLSGEGYFEIISSPQKPFIVHTEKYDVQAIGTTFNIDAYPDNNAFTTTLLEGSIKVHIADYANENIVLKPNEYLSLSGNKLQRGKISDHNHFLWRSGILYFEDVSFPDIMKMLEKHFHLRIEIQANIVNNKQYTGKFRQAEGIDHILRVLQKDVDFKFERLEDNQKIIIK